MESAFACTIDRTDMLGKGDLRSIIAPVQEGEAADLAIGSVAGAHFPLYPNDWKIEDQRFSVVELFD